MPRNRAKTFPLKDIFLQDTDIKLKDIYLQYHQNCDCRLPDPDDCLILHCIMDPIEPVVCELCGKYYEIDTMAIIKNEDDLL